MLTNKWTSFNNDILLAGMSVHPPWVLCKGPQGGGGVCALQSLCRISWGIRSVCGRGVLYIDINNTQHFFKDC